MGSFEYGSWNVEYKFINEHRWHKLSVSKKYWFADPMLFCYENRKYLFTEAFDIRKQIGRIAISTLENGVFSEPQIIIKNPYHMSYPCVFEYNDKIYMIPETSMNGTLELYQPKDDINKEWEKTKVLLRGLKLVDTTVLVKDDIVYLIGYIENNKAKKYVTKIYTLDMRSFQVDEVYTFDSLENNNRPAGNIIYYKGEYLRPLQNNTRMYGECMRVLNCNPDKGIWFGEMVKEIKCEDFPELKTKYQRTHTLGFDGELIILDFLKMEKSRIAPYLLYKRKFRNLIYKIKRGEKII